MGFLRQNTSASVMIGEFIDDTDGKTAEGGLTLTPSDIYLSKNGGAFSGKNQVDNALSDSNLGGWYRCSLDDTDTSASGILQLAVHVAGALPVWHSWMVLPANVYDSVMGNDLLNVNADDLLNTVVEDSYDFQAILQILASVLAGKVSGGNTTTITFQNLSDSGSRVEATVDLDGNRTTVNIDPS